MIGENMLLTGQKVYQEFTHRAVTFFCRISLFSKNCKLRKCLFQYMLLLTFQNSFVKYKQ